jgi:hypothetical protein
MLFCTCEIVTLILLSINIPCSFEIWLYRGGKKFIRELSGMLDPNIIPARNGQQKSIFYYLMKPRYNPVDHRWGTR